jgi:hypothetical protein
MLYTSSLDRAWNDLPIHPGYLPLFQRVLFHLSGRGKPPSDARVGQAVTLGFRQTDEALVVTEPGGSEQVLSRTDAEHDHSEYTHGLVPGFYRVEARSREQKASARPEDDFALNLDPAASDTRRLSITSTRGDITSAALKPKARFELWHAVACALLLFLLCESLVVLKRH